MATMEIVKGHCGNSKCTYDVYTKEKVDELLLEKGEAISNLELDVYDLKKKTNIDEVNVGVPFSFKVQTHDGGKYVTAHDYGTINIPIQFGKLGSNVGMKVAINVKYATTGWEATYDYSEIDGFPEFIVYLPTNITPGTDWRFVAETELVPDKYKMWDYQKIDDNGVTSNGLWYIASGNKITMYSKVSEPNRYLIWHTYATDNTD